MKNKLTNAMRDRLRFNKLWINQWEEYFFHPSISEKTSREMGKESPMVHLLINIYFTPLNALKYLLKMRDLYRYKKFLKETEFLEKALYNEPKVFKKLKK